MPSHFFLLGGIVFLAAQFLAVQPANAVLGEPATSIASDKESLGGLRIAKSAGDGFEVQEIQSEATSVREYISPDGIVFAIAWNGLVHPDLTHLLGSYASEYQQALKEVPRKPGRQSLQVTSSRVIVEKWGHMRNLQGRAYAPDLLPAGVTINEIR
ncbi:protein of unknown function DUF2844 [Geotalea daltonii FRC-32]|uniref:DUF2844 domain-containing protein n=1 Tax=Geotalea daltonii (strain DSM 22248 / JCM 15807 / FRC-32) TaxID=316067 RepID=B9M7J4_GEODF|nr:DUF2844 domain-containing protein [Geotalea daltonii]ACM22100.1 protein of unknown function DUF2844 [Geotalea daltonii FRC-32]